MCAGLSPTRVSLAALEAAKVTMLPENSAPDVESLGLVRMGTRSQSWSGLAPEIEAKKLLPSARSMVGGVVTAELVFS